MSVTANDIRAAATTLQGQVIRTPMLAAPLLSRHFGCDLYLKLECQQYTSSFKTRGAYIAMHGLNSAQRNAGVIAMSANMVLNLLFYLGGWAHIGLALATSLAAYLNAGGLLLMLKRSDVFRLHPGWPRFLFQVLLANVIMMIFVFYGSGSWSEWLDWSVLEQVVRLIFLVFAGVVIYLTVLFATGMRWSQFNR